MVNFGRAVSDSIIDSLSIFAKGVEHGRIDGRITNCDGKYIFIKITNGFEKLSVLATNMMQVFNVDFYINQTPFQLQIQALDLMVEHKLFETLINNPLYRDNEIVQEYSCIPNELK